MLVEEMKEWMKEWLVRFFSVQLEIVGDIGIKLIQKKKKRRRRSQISYIPKFFMIQGVL